MPSSRVMPQKALWFPARHLKEKGWKGQTKAGGPGGTCVFVGEIHTG